MRRALGTIKNPIYKEAYRACVAAGKNRTKATAHHYSNIAKMGADNPMNTELLTRAAKRDYKYDISHLGKETMAEKLTYYAKTMTEMLFNPTYIKSKLKLRKAAKEMYPKTYSARKKILNKGKLDFDQHNVTIDRLDALDISLKSLR